MAKLRVFLDPLPTRTSRSLMRVAAALRAYAPDSVQVVRDPAQADLQVLHVVSHRDPFKYLRAPRYAVIQYALQATSQDGRNVRVSGPEVWGEVWRGASHVWSYYPQLPEQLARVAPNTAFSLSPLGVVAERFPFVPPDVERQVGVMTSGFVSGPGAEAIGEVALAASRSSMRVVHLGPRLVAGMDLIPPGWSNVDDVTDDELARLYGASTWVSGLRYVEGFELPAVEGLLCGARPLLFERPEMRQWYGEHATYVAELEGQSLVDHLAQLLQWPAAVVSASERAAVAERFSWARIAPDVWEGVLAGSTSERHAGSRQASPQAPVRPRPARRRLLWVGDSPTLATGFGVASRHVLRALLDRWDVHVLGTNFDGGPYDQAACPFDVYPPRTMERPNDIYGLGQTAALVTKLRPDVVVVQQDAWNLPGYMRVIGNTATVGVVPVPGRNCGGRHLNGTAGCVFWTAGQRDEAVRGGYLGPTAVVPLGVDLQMFRPRAQAEARLARQLPEVVRQGFIVGWVGRNHPNKRVDLAVRYFAEWIRQHRVDDAYLFVHAGPTGDAGYDFSNLAAYYGIANRLLYAEPEIGQGVPEPVLAATYATMDVLLTTSQGEGWCLPVMEAMACGVPCIVPACAALAEWPTGAAWQVPCTSTAVTPGKGAAAGLYANIIGGVMDEQLAIAALDAHYRDAGERARRREDGLQLVGRPEYRWPAIGAAFDAALESFLWPSVVVDAAQVEEVVAG